MMRIFAERLRRARIEAGYTQPMLSIALGLDHLKVWEYENEKDVPNLDTLCDLADILHTSTDYLLGRTEKETKNA